MSESGLVHWEDHAFALDLDEESRDRLARRVVAKLAAKRATYAPLVRPSDVTDRVVIVVDDGIATGATMGVALAAARARHPERLVVATPVASSQALERLGPLADDIVALSVPKTFFSISQFYEDFAQVSDDDVIRILNESRKKRPQQEANARGRPAGGGHVESPP